MIARETGCPRGNIDFGGSAVFVPMMPGKLISQRNCAKKLRALGFQLQCLEEARQTAHEIALGELSACEDTGWQILPCQKMHELGVQKSMVSLATEECNMMEITSDYVQRLSIQRLRLGMLENRLHLENAWLERQNKSLETKISEVRARIDVEDADVRRYLLFCHLRHGSNISRAENNKARCAFLDKELTLDTTILEAVSSQIKILYHLAVQRLNSGRIEMAVSMCNRALKSSKRDSLDSAILCFVLGLCALRKRKSADAVNRLRSATEQFSSKRTLGKFLVPVFVSYAKALSLDGKYDEAIEQLETSLRMCGEKPTRIGLAWQVKTEIAVNRLLLGKASEAMEIFDPLVEEVTDLLPANDQLLVKMRNYQARCYLRLGQLGKAEDIVGSLLGEVFRHTDRIPLVDLINASEQFEIHNGLDLVELYGTTSDTMELFTIQTLSRIYVEQDLKADASKLLDSYVQLNGVDFEIE